MQHRTLAVTINRTGFAADYTARTYGMIPHKNGVTVELAGVTSGRIENAERFARLHGITRAFVSHAEMLREVRTDSVWNRTGDDGIIRAQSAGTVRDVYGGSQL